MRSLRKWQSECITKVLKKYSDGYKHFLAVATPAAGKTIMASYVIKALFDQNKIDFVIVLSPSVNVSRNFEKTISNIIGKRVDGKLGSVGQSITYCRLTFLDEHFLELFNEYRVFVVCDEIHHCAAASHIHKWSNVWGRHIQHNIQNKAEYTLSLSGTPWRSNHSAIVLADYCQNQLIMPDYIYGLKNAIGDKVCRKPKIVAIDSKEIIFSKRKENSRTYHSIRELIKDEGLPYQWLLEDESIINYMLKASVARLSSIRKCTPNAGGLIVATNIKQAQIIHHRLISVFKQQAEIVTHLSEEPQKKIERFSQSTTSWIVSVAMISEGTDIPRLHVCCYLSRIKTELYFRQVLGRVLRYTHQSQACGYLYIVAEEHLMDFATRVDDDLPEESVIIKTDDFSPISRSNHNNVKASERCKAYDKKESIDNEKSRLSLEDEGSHSRDLEYSDTCFHQLYEEMLKLEL